MALTSTYIEKKITVKADKIGLGSYSNFDPNSSADMLCQFSQYVNSLQDASYTTVVQTETRKLMNLE